MISRTCDKSIQYKLVGVSRMQPVTFQCNLTQISRCKKKLFFRKSLLLPSKYGGKACTYSKKLKFFEFSNMWKKFPIKIGEFILTFQRSLSQITYFCENLFFPQNSKITLICTHKREYRISVEIMTQFVSAATKKSKNSIFLSMYRYRHYPVFWGQK